MKKFILILIIITMNSCYFGVKPTYAYYSISLKNISKQEIELKFLFISSKQIDNFCKKQQDFNIKRYLDVGFFSDSNNIPAFFLKKDEVISEKYYVNNEISSHGPLSFWIKLFDKEIKDSGAVFICINDEKVFMLNEIVFNCLAKDILKKNDRGKTYIDYFDIKPHSYQIEKTDKRAPYFISSCASGTKDLNVLTLNLNTTDGE